MFLRYLNYFLALAKYRSFSEAAEQLYISQSSLSKKIKSLEDSLGVKLFLRNPSGVKLTEYGEIYLKYAKSIKRLEDQCVASLSRVNNEHISVGCIPSMKEYGVVDLVSSFMNKTDIHCKIVTETSGDLEEHILQKQLDIAFVKNPTHTDDLIIYPFTKDHLVAVLPKDHPLAKKETITFRDLEHENFILEPVNSRPYRLIVSLCQKEGFTPTIGYTDRFVENILEFVRNHLGVSLLMSKLVEDNLDGLVAIDITPNVIADITLCVNKETKINDSLQAFIDFVTMR
jgi:DNA-binding transcriptional LysR family regulator